MVGVQRSGQHGRLGGDRNLSHPAASKSRYHNSGTVGSSILPLWWRRATSSIATAENLREPPLAAVSMAGTARGPSLGLPCDIHSRASVSSVRSISAVSGAGSGAQDACRVRHDVPVVCGYGGLAQVVVDADLPAPPTTPCEPCSETGTTAATGCPCLVTIRCSSGIIGLPSSE